MHVYIQ